MMEEVLGFDSMKAEDFSAWLCGIARLTAAQRREALEALAKGVREDAGARLGTEPDASPNGRSGGDSKRRRRPDALGTSGHERVESRGCPHCAGREIIAWGRANGLTRFRCKSCGRSFNALTKTPMARLRKRELWIDHARAMIESRSLSKTADLCGVHPTTAFRWRHRFLGSPATDKPRALTGIVEADETFLLESFKGRRSDLPRKPRKRGGSAKHPGLYQENIPVLIARDRKGATFDAVLPQVDSVSIGAALAGVVTCENHLVCDGGRVLAAFARKAKIPLHAVPAPGKPTAEAPHLHINNVNAYHGRLKQWLSRFNGVATKNLPNYLGWRRALEAWGDLATPRNWIKSAIGDGPYQQLTL
jgi:transposase-like protein